LHSPLSSPHDVIKATPFTGTFTTAAFDRSSFRLFEASPYRAASKGPPSSFVQHGAVAPSCHKPSRPGGFHPEALTEPCVTVSRHTARAILEGCRPPPQSVGSSRRRLTKWTMTRMARPLRSTDITPLPRYYESVRPCPAYRYFRPRGAAACAFSLITAEQVLKFRTKAQVRVTPPVHRTPHGQ